MVAWPVVAINTALLPNGKVLAYDSVGDRATTSFQDHDVQTDMNTPIDWSGAPTLQF